VVTGGIADPPKTPAKRNRTNIRRRRFTATLPQVLQSYPRRHRMSNGAFLIWSKLLAFFLFFAHGSAQITGSSPRGRCLYLTHRVVCKGLSVFPLSNLQNGKGAILDASTPAYCKYSGSNTQVIVNPDESTPGKNERIIRLAARPMEDSSPRSNRNLQHRSACQ
jgi:hypothetical protein